MPKNAAMGSAVRVWGDPFAAGSQAAALRACIAAVWRRGRRCALALPGRAAWLGDAAGAGRALALAAPAGETRTVWTALEPAPIAAIARALDAEVPAAAPVLVFSDRADDELLASLEFPAAVVVRRANDACTPDALLDCLSDAAAPAPEAASDVPMLPMADLAPWLALPLQRGGGTLLHPGGSHDDGTDLAVRAFARAVAATGAGHGDSATAPALVVLLPRRAPALERALSALAEHEAPGAGARVEFQAGEPTPELASLAAAVLLPFRRFTQPGMLLRALASGRPVAASRFAESARALPHAAAFLPIGGRRVGTRFQPALPAVADAVARLLAPAKSERLPDPALARRHVLRHHAGDVAVPAGPCHAGAALLAPLPPAITTTTAPAAAVRRRPRIVLEAPLLETSSTAVLTLATARALVARDRVDVRLVATPPFAHGLDRLRAAAPELLPLLERRPRDVDLWLASGWPPRATRPEAACFAVRLDWEYGALPTELTPLVPQEADRIVVHSRCVRRAVAASGRPAATIDLVPHGVAAAFHEQAPPLPRVLRWKGDRQAILFVGGLVFRKGFDVLLGTVLRAVRRQEPFCLVVKPVGGESCYRGYELGELLARVQRSSQAIDTLVVDEDLDATAMAGLYTACDLLVHPYRGEGFALPVLEARACGLPVLVTEGGSTDDYCDDPQAVRIPATKRFVELPGAHEGRPFLLEPDGDGAALLLRAMLERLPAMRAAARAAAPAVRRRHGWERAAAALEAMAFTAARPRPEPALLEARR